MKPNLSLGNKTYSLGLFILASILFYVNDLFFISAQSEYYHFVAFDYGTRLISLFVFGVAGYKYKDFSKSNSHKVEKLLITLFMVVTGIVLLKFCPILVSSYQLFSFPSYPTQILRLLDLIFGLLLVAISEELLFRGYLMNLLQKYFDKKLYVVLLSTFAFSLIHWGGGVDVLVKTFLWGLIPSFYYMKTKNLLPCIIGHYITNLIVYY